MTPSQIFRRNAIISRPPAKPWPPPQGSQLRATPRERQGCIRGPEGPNRHCFPPFLTLGGRRRLDGWTPPVGQTILPALTPGPFPADPPSRTGLLEGRAIPDADGRRSGRK